MHQFYNHVMKIYFELTEMNVGVNKQMAPPVPPAKTCGGKKEVRLNSMPWFHGKVGR